MAKTRIGISGWHYPPWRGVFYPQGLRQQDELRFAAAQFSTIEINASFYRLQTPAVYRSWRRATPAGFVFAVKGPRFITHMKRLKDIDDALSVFLSSGPLELGSKLGPFLWQLPPSFRFDAARIERFLAGLPRNGAQAWALAGTQAASRLTDAFKRRRLRHALEVRHQSFLDPDFIRLARAYGVAVAVSDGARRWPMLTDVSAGFMYVRLHGEQKLYGSRYSDASLRRWRDRLAAWQDGGQREEKTLVLPTGAPARRARDVYVYFDNDTKVDAPFDARRLRAQLHDHPPSRA